MKLYILRHEDRPIDCSFFSPLTEKGLINANNLIPFLNKCQINYIISSPFIRTLQTIYPYVKNKKLLINIEYGLSEIHHQDIIPKKAVGQSLPEYLAKYFNYNKSYDSFIKHHKITYPEIYEDVDKRLKNFLQYFFTKFIKTNYIVVLVTHQSLCKVILEIVNKYNLINKELLNNYPKGKLCLVFDNGWCCKEIN